MACHHVTTPRSAPETVYEHFAKGEYFSIKVNKGTFTAVGGDQKLKQTINLSSKRSDAVIGNSKKKHYVAQWDLIYHEILSVKNTHNEYAGVIDYSFERLQNHEFSSHFTKKMENQIQRMVKYIEEKGSLLSENCSGKLQNFVTKELM